METSSGNGVDLSSIDQIMSEKKYFPHVITLSQMVMASLKSNFGLFQASFVQSEQLFKTKLEGASPFLTNFYFCKILG